LLELGFVSAGDHRGAIAEADRALMLSPNLAFAFGRRGEALINFERTGEGIRDLQTSLRLDPRGSMQAVCLGQVAVGFYHSRAYEDAVRAAKDTVRLFPEYPLAYRWLAAGLGQLSQIEEAEETLEKAMAIAPASFDMYVRHRVPWMRPEDHAHMVEGLRKAGGRNKGGFWVPMSQGICRLMGAE
jgi:adenylate cyclase